MLDVLSSSLHVRQSTKAGTDSVTRMPPLVAEPRVDEISWASDHAGGLANRASSIERSASCVSIGITRINYYQDGYDKTTGSTRRGRSLSSSKLTMDAQGRHGSTRSSSKKSGASISPARAN